MRFLIAWRPCPGAPVHEDGYQDSQQVIIRDNFQQVDDDDFGELIGTRIKDVRRNEQNDIIFELDDET